MKKPVIRVFPLLFLMLVAAQKETTAESSATAGTAAAGSTTAAGGEPGGVAGLEGSIGGPDTPTPIRGMLLPKGRPRPPCRPGPGIHGSRCPRPPPCTPYTPSNTTCRPGTHKCVVRQCYDSYDFCGYDNDVGTCGQSCEPCPEPSDKFQVADCRKLRDTSVDGSIKAVYACGMKCMEGFTWNDGRQTCVRPLPAECASITVPEGYWLEANLDSPWSDLERVGGLGPMYAQNWQVLAAACDKLPECAAVNSDGWMKYRVMPRNPIEWNLQAWENPSNPCGGILVKKAGATPIPKPAVPGGPPEKPLAACKKNVPAGYRFVSRSESAYNNIRQVPLTTFTSSEWSKLAAECDAELTCVAANTLGWLKRSLRGVNDWTSFGAKYPCHGLLVKTKCNAKVPDGYVFHVNKDSGGNDISQVPGLSWDARDWPVITAACSADATCKAVNTDGYMKHKVMDVKEWSTQWGFPNSCAGMFIKQDGTNTTTSVTTASAAAEPNAEIHLSDEAFAKKLIDIRAAIAANATSAR